MPEPAKAVEPVKKSSVPAPLKLVSPMDLFDRMQQLTDSIARRAFGFFEGNGRIFGRDLDDWFQAESELIHPVHVDVAESDEGLTVHAEVPGFTAKELEVSVEPRPSCLCRGEGFDPVTETRCCWLSQERAASLRPRAAVRVGERDRTCSTFPSCFWSFAMPGRK